jgi:hypothetical protein
MSESSSTTASAGQNGKVARRVLLTAGGLALCGGAVALSPIALNKAGQYTADKIDQALAAGVANGRLALLHELETLEGTSIEVAVSVANLTKLAVKFIVGPAAAVMAALGTTALNVLISSLETANTALGFIPGGANAQAPLQHLHDMLVTWRLNLTSLPKQLSDFLNWDIDSAEKYLIALQNKINAEKNATPVNTPNTGLPLGK